MTIEEYLYRTDAFHFTTAATPYPLPIARAPTALNQEVLRILTTLVPAIRRINLVDTWKPGYPDCRFRILTVLIEVYQETSPSDSWLKIRDQIQTLLHVTHLFVIDIEIIDNECAFIPSIFPQNPETG